MLDRVAREPQAAAPPVRRGRVDRGGAVSRPPVLVLAPMRQPTTWAPATSRIRAVPEELPARHAPSARGDTKIRRMVKFDEVLDNVVSTWRDDAMRKFTADGSDVPMKTAEFVVTNLKRGWVPNPMPLDFALTSPFLHAPAIAAARSTYTKEMLPLYEELKATTAPLGPKKGRISTIRKELQRLWAEMVEDLGDDRSAAKVEWDSVARTVADEILALEANVKRKARKAEKDGIVKKHAEGFFVNAFYIDQAASKLVAAAKQPLKQWQQNAKNTLSPDHLAMFNKERAMIEQRLEQWATKQKDGQGTNAEGTYGTSFGGSGSGFAHNPLPQAVYDALLVWWATVPGPTWTSDSLTTDHSLKKQRVTPHDKNLSPRFNYHIVIAPP
jgi:hypothetical protein